MRNSLVFGGVKWQSIIFFFLSPVSFCLYSLSISFGPSMPCIYIRQRCSCWAPRRNKKMIDEVVYIYISTFLRLWRLPILFFSLSPPLHRRKMSLISVLSVPSLSRQMNEWAWCIDRSREFLISPNRSSSSIFPPSLFHITFGDMCLVLVLFLIVGHKGPTGVYTERGGVGSKSSMRIYCAGRRRRRSRRKKGIKI